MEREFNLANARVMVESTCVVPRSLEEVKAHLHDYWVNGAARGRLIVTVAAPLVGATGLGDTSNVLDIADMADEIHGQSRGDVIEFEAMGAGWRFELAEQANGTRVRSIQYNTSRVGSLVGKRYMGWGVRRQEKRLLRWAESSA
jgi:hypothetical protein